MFEVLVLRVAQQKDREVSKSCARADLPPME